MIVADCVNCSSLFPELINKNKAWYCAEQNKHIRSIEYCPTKEEPDIRRIREMLEEIGL